MYCQGAFFIVRATEKSRIQNAFRKGTKKMKTFGKDPELLTVMVQGATPDRIRELMTLSIPEGAEAFGMQFEQLRPEYRTKEIYRELFASAGMRPVYATNYRTGFNEGKPDGQLAAELLELAECGATLCDMMGDYFDRQPDEMATSPVAIEKQRELIDRLHQRGVKVLMSSHVFRFTPAERVLEMALEQQRRGADICKIVTGASDVAEELENLRIIPLLKEALEIPFLFLSVGQCGLLRRIGGKLGCCMYLCVHEQDGLSAPAQPLLRDVKLFRDRMIL